jgi:uncharacterized protein (TIGR02118 family)
MHKRVTLLSSKSTATATEFREHWAERHGPLVCNLPGLAAYRQHDVQATRLGYPCQGIVEACFADADALTAAFQSVQARALLPDEANFIGAKLVMDVVRTRSCESGHGTNHVIVLGRCSGNEAHQEFLPAPDLLSDYRFHRVLRTTPHGMPYFGTEPAFFNILTVDPTPSHEVSARIAEVLAQVEAAIDPAMTSVFVTRSREIVSDQHHEAIQ